MKKLIVILLVFLYFPTTNMTTIFTVHATAPTIRIPPLPPLHHNKEQIAIVMMEKEMSTAEIKQLLQKYPQIQLRKIFTKALKGFSVIGPGATLEQFSQKEPSAQLTFVSHYSAAGEDNMELIGTHQVRGIMDSRLTGKGIKIGVIDTGIDHQHRDLRRNYGGGFDVVDGDGDPMETHGTQGQNTIHGTHVAGIIAANGKMKGVAPEATIFAYRALGPGGVGSSEQIIAAIEQAIKDKVDILNLSLGSNVNGPDLPLSVALNRAVEQGITAVTSSGNSGPDKWTVGSPGTATKAISVGASTPTLQIPHIISNDGEKIRLEPMQGSIPWKINREYELIDGGLGKPQELKNAEGKIALIRRGEFTFSEKVKNAAKAGAIAAIIYNNTNGPLLGNLEEVSDIPVMGVTKKAGENLKKKLVQESTYVRALLIEEKDLLADFSSRGPVTSTWEVKPDLVAPGVAIESTIPGGYLSLQGTSMAAPHVTGACALIKQAHPDWSPQQIKAALMNYAKPLMDQNGQYYHSYEQGAGRIRLKEAINAEVLAYPASLQFGKFGLSDKLHEHKAQITIENTSKRQKSISFQIPKREEGLDWHLPMSFMLKGGEKRTVEIQLSADPDFFRKKIQDGALEMAVDGQEIRIPYLFVLEEPNYPRVMGFDFGAGDRGETFRYEVYLPGGADEFGIALFDPDSYQFIQFLDWKRNVGKGLLQEELTKERLPAQGIYLVKVFARKSGQEDTIDTYLNVPD